MESWNSPEICVQRPYGVSNRVPAFLGSRLQVDADETMENLEICSMICSSISASWF